MTDAEVAGLLQALAGASVLVPGAVSPRHSRARTGAADANPARDVRRALLPSRATCLCHLAAVILVPTAAEAWALPVPAPLRILYYPLRRLRQARHWSAWLAGPRGLS